MKIFDERPFKLKLTHREWKKFVCETAAQVDGELTKRLDKLNSISRDLETFQHTSDSFQNNMDESLREIEEYRKYVATSDDFSAVRNSFQV
jgi:DNA repair ATPase RecN